MPSPLAALVAVVSAALDRSRDHFRGRDAVSVGVAVLLVGGVAVGTALGIVGLGLVFDATIDETVTVDNPDQPPEWVCESEVHGEESPVTAGCDRPDRIDVDVGAELRDAAAGLFHYGLIGVVVWWGVFAGVLHGGARIAGGNGSFADSLVVAAWAIVPELLRVGIGLAVIGYALATADVGGGGFETIAADVTAAIGGASGPLFAASVATVAIQWFVVVGGLEATHDLDRLTAGVLAGVFGGLLLASTAL
ncbi:YIP1 family protein [Halorubrum sp. JWXQ-INN 858]|uniref:YIP1 family protein n=1 Tax=Halorubrum sp. JWXQ-INN 858 TaxID=2690782 RepID=UPI0013FC79C9|nr:YIP1 family protein [Halorubrum sp. JWXQ-INN 858]MWV65820.1 YIP1 family protein [Halorubrum sp. JWXQ-INN 858]